MNPSVLKDKVPPHNDEAEQATLGALLLDAEAVPLVLRFLRPGDMYNAAHQKIYAAILELSNTGKTADLITLTEQLRSKGELESSGGPAYISSLTSIVPTSANVEYYAKIVQECSIRRLLLRTASEITARSYDDSQDSRLVVEEAERLIFSVSDMQTILGFKSAKDVIPATIDAIEKLYHNKNAYTGVPTGFEELDHLTAGFQKSELIIIGARPSVGKTALALSMTINIAVANKIPVGFFTLEMSDMALMQRIISAVSHIPSEKIRGGTLRTSDFQSIMDAAGRIYDAPLYIVDAPNMKLLDLRAQARRLKMQQQVQIIFIDYLTLISSENPDLPRHEQIAEISRSLKSLARELDIPVVALSQVRRETEGKMPSLADIRESGSIEQDADVVIFLHREKETEPRHGNEGKGSPVKTEIIVAKQRNGPVGDLSVLFFPSTTKFESIARNASQ